MGKYMKYKELLEKTDSIAGGFADLGVKEGDSVTLAMPNIFEAVIAFYALVKLGAVMHMVHPLTPVAQMERFMQETNSKMLVVVDTFYGHYQSLLRNQEVRMILASPVQLFGSVKNFGYKLINKKRLKEIRYSGQVLKFEQLYSEKSSEEAKPDSRKTACLLHSGGTSGEPKTIELSHFAINFLADKLKYILNIEEFNNVHMLAVLPMFHGFGLCMGIHGMFTFGGVNTLMPKFSPKESINYIKKDQINIIIGVPSLFEALLHDKKFDSDHVRNIKQCFVGGDYTAMDLKNRFDDMMKKHGSKARLLEGYGLTEVVTVCAVNTLRDHNQQSVGRPLPDIDMRIVDLTTRAFLKADQPGEIAVSAPTIMNGYLNDPVATKRTIVELDGKNFVLTGDLGSIDKNGYVHYKQRLKRIIKVSGMPVLPAEIENLVMNFSDVKEVAAIGIPDKEKNFVVKLFVVFNKNVDRDLIFTNIKSEIKKNLGLYAVPKVIAELDVLPKTLIGKTDTIALEKL